MNMNMVEKKISIVMVEDNKELCTLFEEYFLSQKNFEFLGAAYNGLDGLEMIRSKKPDIALIDIVLPVKDGLSILEDLQENKCDKQTICIALTGASSEIIITKAMLLGAEYIFLKPFKLDIMSKRLIQIYESKPYFFEKNELQRIDEVMRTEKDDSISLEEMLRTLLTSFGIAVHLKGYKYLRRAIIICIEDEYMLEGITKILYPLIAKEYNTSVMSVEHGIRNALNSAWKKNCSVNYYKTLGIESENVSRPTNSSFISNIVDHFRINIISKQEV